MDQKRFTPSTYKTPPPYGKNVFEWVKFFLRPHQKTLWFFTLVHIPRKIYFQGHAFFLGILIALVTTFLATGENWLHIPLWIAFYSFLGFLTSAAHFLMPGQHNMTDRISKEISLFGLKHYLKLSESWHENRASGEKLQRILSARHNSYDLITTYYWQLLNLPAIFFAIILAITALSAPWYYIPLLFTYLISYIYVSYICGEWLRKKYVPYNETLENTVGKAYEFLTSTITIRFFNLKNYVQKTALHYEDENYQARRDVHKVMFLRWFWVNNTALFWILVTIGLASYDALQGNLGIPAFTAIIFLSVQIWYDTEVFALIYAQMIEQFTGFKRLIDILNIKPEIEDKENAAALDLSSATAKKPPIHFENVSFEYNQNKGVLNDFSLKINPGQKIGLIGPSGAGKSTIVKLLMRFYEPQSGTISIGGQNIADVTQESLQDHIAVIPQDISLFNHSLMDNIRYGNLQASDEEVIEAAKRAAAHDFILDLPDGYETIVGERGVKLSGGQRQRIAIARAILKNAPILVLDEATSALDSESEQAIQASLQNLMRGKTVIAIAHRLSTISSLDRLIVMDQGKIIEEGTHEDLRKKDGLYARLWNLQSGGFLA